MAFKMEFLLALKCCILDQANSESYFVGNSREILTSGIGRVGVCMANADGGKLGIRGTVNPEMNLSIDPRPHIDRDLPADLPVVSLVRCNVRCNVVRCNVVVLLHYDVSPKLFPYMFYLCARHTCASTQTSRSAS